MRFSVLQWFYGLRVVDCFSCGSSSKMIYRCLPKGFEDLVRCQCFYILFDIFCVSFFTCYDYLQCALGNYCLLLSPGYVSRCFCFKTTCVVDFARATSYFARVSSSRSAMDVA